MEEKLTCSLCEAQACKPLFGAINTFTLSSPSGIKYSKTVNDDEGHGLLCSETVTVSLPARSVTEDMLKYNRRWYTLKLRTEAGTWKSVGSSTNSCQMGVSIDGSDATITFTTQKAIL